MGPGNTCEIGSCKDQAYAVCDFEIHQAIICVCFDPKIKGCGRKLCERHIDLEYNRRG